MTDDVAARSAGRFAAVGVACTVAAGASWTVLGAVSSLLVTVLLVAALVAFGVAANRVKAAAGTTEDDGGEPVEDGDSTDARRQKARHGQYGGNA